jgi:hypothetical protein
LYFIRLTPNSFMVAPFPVGRASLPRINAP